jgi:hypothetical protein
MPLPLAASFISGALLWFTKVLVATAFATTVLIGSIHLVKIRSATID